MNSNTPFARFRFILWMTWWEFVRNGHDPEDPKTEDIVLREVEKRIKEIESVSKNTPRQKIPGDPYSFFDSPIKLSKEASDSPRSLLVPED